jgi:mono/diheme cytochrome c family protein
VAAAAQAQGEHARRLAAELAIMHGDLRRLAAAQEPAEHLEGLRARFAGALSSLPLLVREAGERADAGEMRALRAALAGANWKTLEAGIAGLRRRYPLDLSGILPADPTPERLRLGEVIHRQACAGCHDNPASGSRLPAHNLFKQANTMLPEELAARLLNGVRGDASTAHRNPFGDLEIGALIAYYRAGARP